MNACRHTEEGGVTWVTCLVLHDTLAMLAGDMLGVQVTRMCTLVHCHNMYASQFPTHTIHVPCFSRVHVKDTCVAHFTIHNNRVPRRRHHVIVICVHLDVCERIAVATVDSIRNPFVLRHFNTRSLSAVSFVDDQIMRKF